MTKAQKVAAIHAAANKVLCTYQCMCFALGDFNIDGSELETLYRKDAMEIGHRPAFWAREQQKQETDDAIQERRALLLTFYAEMVRVGEMEKINKQVAK